MKYLIPLTLLLALCGCEKYYSETKGDTNAIAKPDAESDIEKILKTHIGRSGLYRLVRSGGVINDPSTSTGKSVSKPVVELVRTTDRIPLIKGGQMYFQYRIWPLPERPAYVDLRRVLKHPKMALPNGKVTTGSDFIIKGRVNSSQVIAYTGYGLDEDYEMVEGDWIFEIWYKDKKMIEQKFTTYRPDRQEVSKLEPILALGNKAAGQQESTKDSFSRFDWPKITVGGSTPPKAAVTSDVP